MHSLTLGDVLRENRRSYPQRDALVCQGARYTYPQMDERVNRLANALLAEGFGPGERIMWLGQNCHRVLEGLLAAAKVGGVFCPVNWRQTAEELAFVIDDLDPRVVLWQDAEIGDAVRAARTATGSTAVWLQHDGGAGNQASYEAFLAGGAPADPCLDVDPSTPVLQLYTAAFTGRPNGAQLSHTAIVTQDLIMAMLQEVTTEYRYLNAGPLFHIATFMTTLAAFHMGGTNVFTRRADAEELCRLIDAERCTGAFVMGPTIDQMIEVNKDGRYDLKSLRTFPGKRAWTDMITVDTSPWARKPAGYGQTEVMGMLSFNAVGGEAVGTSGRPSPAVQVRIVDPDGNEVPPGETGEIVARGPTVMYGYFNRPDLNEQRQAGGWHHTNDLGRRESDGSITFVGPKTRIVKSAAENIYPAEVEACINKHPAVKEAAVIGVPDPTWTQSVKAIVVLKDGETATAGDIIEHCRAAIASYKKPKFVEFIDTLPRDGWLVDYDALDEEFGGGGYPGGRSH
ncbi:MAG: AMP-binding protein [Acidimicrobiia bacterium]|nr:AMP-binding protein [Acidimicrobiia bacterium]